MTRWTWETFKLALALVVSIAAAELRAADTSTASDRYVPGTEDAGKDDKKSDKSKSETPTADAELRRSMDELRSSLDRLTKQLQTTANGNVSTATTWVREQAGVTEKALRDAGNRIDSQTSAAQAAARSGVIDAMQGLSKAVNGFTDKVKEATNQPGKGAKSDKKAEQHDDKNDENDGGDEAPAK